MYLWKDEARRGQEEGLKARPCVIVDVGQNDFDETEVHIAPITHTQPKEATHALEIPPQTKQRLKLDQDQSWIITNDPFYLAWS